ncbi:hypothetical protein NDU88_010437 [Pleurodeles waltl]|uniref:Uncharacterized protein n=1 Tax=Pleurodeles waltl TaxID=8319 RepID=A0AAV7QVX5_PLEWA|nr:hypothetical protein NDU88_010437 [Pleurodeles waltl]
MPKSRKGEDVVGIRIDTAAGKNECFCLRIPSGGEGSQEHEQKECADRTSGISVHAARTGLCVNRESCAVLEERVLCSVWAKAQQDVLRHTQRREE